MHFRRPMVCLAAAFMTGTLLGRFFPWTLDDSWLGWLAAGLVLVTALLPPRSLPDAPAALPADYGKHIVPVPGWLARRGLGLFILAATLAMLPLGMWRQAAWERGLDAARAGLPEKPYFNGTLVALEPSRAHGGEEGGWRAAALLLAADGGSVAIPIRLSGPAGPAFRRGDMIQARLRGWERFPKTFPGAFDFELWLEREGLAASLSVAGQYRGRSGKPAYEVVAIESPPLFVLARRGIDSVRSKAISLTLEYGGDRMGGMLAAMLYGFRKDMDADARDAFRRVGIGHVLAISGLHVGLVVSLLWWLSGWVGWSSRRRALACLVLAIFYLGLAGGQVAAMRATVMAVVHLAGIAWGRKSDMLNSLGLAALLLTAANPSAPADVSFQLSFTAVVFIFIALSPRPAPSVPGRRPGGTKLARFRREASSLAVLSFATWFGLFPIIMTVFHQVNLIGLVINIVAIPLMSLVLAGGLLLPWLGWVPGCAWFLVLPGEILMRLALWADKLPYASFPAHAPAPVWMFVFYGLFLALLAGRYVKRRRVRLAWNIGSWLAIFAASAGLAASAASLPPPAGGRLSLLPAWGMDVMVVEDGRGNTALFGFLSKDGLREANWLHYLKRSGPVGVFHLDAGRDANTYPALAYHSGITHISELRAAKGGDGFVSGRNEWTPLPGFEGVEIAASRDGSGRMIWLAARTENGSACVAGRLTARQLVRRLERGMPGSDADLLVAGRRQGDAVPDPAEFGGPVLPMLRGERAGNPPAGWLNRDMFGVLVIEGGRVRGYDGGAWLELKRED